MKTVIKFLLFSTALMPLIVLPNLPFPFVVGKLFFFRSIIEIALALFLVYQFKQSYLNRISIISQPDFKRVFKNPLFIFLSLFLISLIISAIFAVNPYRAFWGDLERGEGLFGFLHFFAFMIMTAAIFEKKDWLNFSKISLGVGFILILYAFLQYFKVKTFPFLLISEERPLSFIGNPAFLATHMFFVMIFAGILAFSKPIKPISPIRLIGLISSISLIGLAAITIFLTGTRGAILGLGVMILFLLVYFAIWGRATSLGRRMSIVLLVVLALFSAIFFMTRGADVWQKIPGLNRLAKTESSGVVDASTQFRIITWKLSWNAFKEKPFFGWGPENYLMAYEKNYDPIYATYGESWMDRAHSKVFDLLVMQGAFGLLTYLGIFIALVYKLVSYASFKFLSFNNNQQAQLTNLQTYKLIKLRTIFIIAGLIGYFVQNLFVMDQLVSDYVFFALIGFIFSKSLISADTRQLAGLIDADKKSASINQNQRQSALTYKLINLKTISLGLLTLVLMLIIIYGLYAYNYIPYIQAKIINETKKIDRASLIENKIREASQPYNFSQFNLRANIVDYLYNYQPHIFQVESLAPLSNFLMDIINEVLQREPYDVRMFIRKAQMAQSAALNNAELYKESEKAMRKAIEISPTRQELYYNLSFALLGQEKFQEAIEVSKQAIELNPEVARSHYNLAFVLAVIGSQHSDEIIKEMEVADNLSPNLEGLRAGDHNLIALVYSRLNRFDKVAEIVLKKINLRLPDKFLQIYYEESLGYFAAMRDMENFIKVAKDAIDANPHTKDDMDVLIDLAKKGNWEIINNLGK